MPARLLNWDVHLVHWVVEMRGRPFTFGETCCGTLVREAMRAIYGVDLWPELTWDSQFSAAKVLRGHGGFRRLLVDQGAELVDYAFVQSGDILLADPIGDPSLFGLAAVAVAGQVLIADETRGVSLEAMPGEPPDAVYRLPWKVGRDGSTGGA